MRRSHDEESVFKAVNTQFMPCFVVFMRTCPHKFLYAKFAVESVLFYKAVVMYVMHNLFGGLVWYGVAHRYFTLKVVFASLL